MTNAYQRSAKGISSEYSASIDSLFSKWDRDRSPGAMIAVIANGKTIHRRGYGVANVEDDVPFTKDTVLRLGSTSKHLCATCCLILQNKGQLDLEDDLRKYIPEMPDYGSIITLRHLLTMTSGLRDGLNMLLFCGMDTSVAVTREQMFGIFQSQRALMFLPGDDCQYSNSNYALLSLVIERISGKTLGEFIELEIFAPLGMKDSALIPFDTRISANKARGYVPATGGALETGLMHVELSGDGGIDSTIEDMIRWFMNYRDDRTFGPNYRQRMEVENRLNDSRLVDYRLGIEVGNYRGLEKIHHAGGMPGYLCDFVFYPETDLGIILLSNMFDPKLLELPDRIADIVLQESLPEPFQSTFVSESDSNAAMLRGVFASEEHGLLVEFVVEDGQLFCYLLGNATPLMSIGDNRFAPVDRSIVIELQEKTVAAAPPPRPGIRLTSGCQPPVMLLPLPDPRRQPAPSAALPDDLTGYYFSDELKETHEVTLNNGVLQVNISSAARDLVWRTLIPFSGNLFGAIIDGEPSCTNVAAKFMRNDKGICNGLSYNINRCHDVYFRKTG